MNTEKITTKTTDSQRCPSLGFKRRIVELYAKGESKEYLAEKYNLDIPTLDKWIAKLLPKISAAKLAKNELSEDTNSDSTLGQKGTLADKPNEPDDCVQVRKGNKPHSPYTKEFKQKVIAEYENNVGFTKLCKKYKISRAALSRWINEMSKKADTIEMITETSSGIPRRESNRRRKFSTQFKAMVVNSYNNGESFNSLCREFDLDYSTLDRWIKDSNLSDSTPRNNDATNLELGHTGKEPEKQVNTRCNEDVAVADNLGDESAAKTGPQESHKTLTKEFRPEFKREVIRLYLNGKSKSFICTEFGLAPQSLNSWIDSVKTAGFDSSAFEDKEYDIERARVQPDYRYYSSELKQKVIDSYTSGTDSFDICHTNKISRNTLDKWVAEAKSIGYITDSDAIEESCTTLDKQEDCTAGIHMFSSDYNENVNPSDDSIELVIPENVCFANDFTRLLDPDLMDYDDDLESDFLELEPFTDRKIDLSYLDTDEPNIAGFMHLQEENLKLQRENQRLREEMEILRQTILIFGQRGSRI